MTREEFKKEIGNFKEIKNLHYCLLNVLNLIWYNGYYYCFCEKFEGSDLEFSKRKFTLCRMLLIFCDFEKKLDINSKGYLLLRSYHQKLFTLFNRMLWHWSKIN